MQYLLAALAMFLGEEGLKNRIERRYALNQKKPVLNGKIIITRHHNYGFAHNRMSDNRRRVLGASIISIVLVVGNALYVFFSQLGGVLKTGMMFLLAGGMSNVYDRLIRKYVVDYFIINVGRLKKTIFNLADIMLFLGTILCAIGSMRKTK